MSLKKSTRQIIGQAKRNRTGIIKTEKRRQYAQYLLYRSKKERRGYYL